MATNEHLTLQTCSEKETAELGRLIGEKISAPVTLLLTGKLGVGKSVFARGIARGLGITEPVRSPTFTLVNEHIGRLPLFHADLYRLESRDVLQLGLEEIVGHGVLIVEWAEKWTSPPPNSARIGIQGAEDERTLTIEGPASFIWLCRAALEGEES